MRLFPNKRIIVVGLVCAFAANSALASGGSRGSSNTGCHDGGGGTPSSFCDTWSGAYNYDMYPGSSNVDQGYSTSDVVTANSVVVDGVNIQVSAWSDTGNYNGDYSRYGQTKDGSGWGGEEDSSVQSAVLSSGPGWRYGVENSDSGDHHAIDNLKRNEFGETDYDMVLFSFSENVSLEGATFSWLLDSASTQQVSIVGLNDISGLTNGSSSWADIESSSAVVNKGSFQIEKCGDVYVSEFTTTSSAQYWLVGAYNTIFGEVDGGSINNDAFKLATIGFVKDGTSPKPPTDVDAPSSFAFLLLSGSFVAWRNRQRKTK